MYQGMGYKVGWNVRQYHFTVSSAIEGLASSKVPPSVEILPASQGDFEKIFTYSADMLGTSRTCRSSLAAWLCYLQESSWVAVANKREVVGLLMMSRTSRFPEEGYHIGPFYADSAPIARSLLKVAVDFARASNPGHIFLRLPVDRNPEGVKILENEDWSFSPTTISRHRSCSSNTRRTLPKSSRSPRHGFSIPLRPARSAGTP